MLRPLPRSFEEVVAAGHIPYVLFVELHFDQVLYVCTAGYTMTWGGHDWIGLGLLGSIESITEQATLEATSVNLTLSGVPSETIAIGLGEQYQGRPCKIHFGVLSEDLAIVDTPTQIFSGRIDTMTIEVGETATINVSVESRLVSWERARVRRYNNGDQIVKYPNDRGMEYVAQMVEKELRWG